LVELRQRRDGIGTRGSLICDISKKGSGIAGAFLEVANSALDDNQCNLNPRPSPRALGAFILLAFIQRSVGQPDNGDGYRPIG
jgi:hypothetical protein